VSKSKNLYILGYSGHAYVVIDVARSNNFTVKGYFDNEASEENPYSVAFCGSERETDFPKIVGDGYAFPAIGSNAIREEVMEIIESNNLKEILLVDPSARISDRASIKKSTLIAPRVVVNSMADIGKGCILNTGAIVEHECEIRNFAHIAPGAVLAGNVIVGEKAFVGANATIKQGISIGRNTVIGAGAMVLENVPDGETWAGNPAVKIR